MLFPSGAKIDYGLFNQPCGFVEPPGEEGSQERLESEIKFWKVKLLIVQSQFNAVKRYVVTHLGVPPKWNAQLGEPPACTPAHLGVDPAADGELLLYLKGLHTEYSREVKAREKLIHDLPENVRRREAKVAWEREQQQAQEERQRQHFALLAIRLDGDETTNGNGHIDSPIEDPNLEESANVTTDLQ
jgi:hypothetical protein